MSKPHLHVCPHQECGRLLNHVEYHQGIVFCPYCQKSLLVNPLKADIRQMTFWQFVIYFTKHQWKRYVVIGILLMVFIWGVFNFEHLNISTGVGMVLLGVGLMVLGFGIYRFEKSIKCHKLYDKPIISGIDQRHLIEGDDNISVALEDLKAEFCGFAVCCPHCQSQRLHQKDQVFICQHCHHAHTLNPKLTRIGTCQNIMSYVPLVLLIGSSVWVNYVWFVVLLFIINLVGQYYWHKTDKWHTIFD